jgi:hypothetical protein
MAIGDQSRGLIQSAKTRGWDPTVIPARGDKPAHSIANFDKEPDRPNYGDSMVGELPGGTPLSWPNGYDVNIGEGIQAPAFATPDTTYDSGVKSRRTRNANPVVGKEY